MSDAVMVAIISGVMSIVVNLGSKWLDNKNGLSKDIKDIKNDISDLKKNDQQNGDMIYQILDHLATSNNTGEMKRALDEYNEHFRHAS